MKKLALITDRNLLSITSKVDGIMNVALSCRSIATFNRKIINYQRSDIDGLLIALSNKVEEDVADLFRETCTLWKVFNKKMVVYSQSEEIYDILEEVINETNLDCDIVFLEPQKELTELFIKESMIGSFCSDNIYTKEEIVDNTVERVNKRVMSTEEKPSDSLLEFMQNLLIQDVSEELSDASKLSTLMARPNEFVKDDNMISEIDTMIETLTQDMKELDDKSEEYNNGKIQLKILNVLRDNRDIKIKSELLRKFISNLRNDINSENNNVNMEDIELHKQDVAYLKTKQVEMEKRIVATIEESKKTIVGINRLFNLPETKTKITLLREDIKNLPYREAIKEAIKVGKESLLNVQSLQADMKSILNELNLNLQDITKSFGEYTQLRDKIDILHTTQIDKLIRSKQINLIVKTNLESKLYTVCGLTPDCGASLTACGLASVKENSLLIDLRLDNPTSKAYVNKEPQFVLEDWITKSVDDIVENIESCRFNVIQPELCAILIDDRKEFFTKILTVLERVSDMYDRVVVILNPEASESKVFLDYAVVNIMVGSPNVSRIADMKTNVNRLMTYKNIKIRYLMYTPVPNQFDTDKALALLGLSRDFVRAVSIPFMPVDYYKLSFGNIFYEKPIYRNNFDV